MTGKRWLIYGAYGYSGELVAERAVARGHAPIVAGRSESKLRPVAERFGLEHRVATLEEPASLRRALEGCEVVLHAAGPFVRTAAPMRAACLEAGVSYLDITGEIPVLAATLGLDGSAKEKGLTFLSGVGFDVVPTDCLALHVAEQVPDATTLDIAICPLSHASAGTTVSSLELLQSGSAIRRAGKLEKARLGAHHSRVRFLCGEREVLGIPWGDLETAYASTRIPNITTYLAMPKAAVLSARLGGALLTTALRVPPIREAAQSFAARVIVGPDENLRRDTLAYVWARAEGPSGRVEAHLETLEGYAFTAASCVSVVERVLAGAPSGAFTPAQAFGKDFVLDIEGTRRVDGAAP